MAEKRDPANDSYADVSTIEAEGVSQSSEATVTEIGRLDRSRLPAHLRFVRVVGRGGMSIVIAALDERTNKEVAVKIATARMLEHPELRSRFEREVEVCARLAPTVPGLMPVIEADVARGLLVMPLLQGGTLRDKIKWGALSAREVRRVGASILQTLAALHGHGLIHRDIKPSNILFDEYERVFIADLGIAHIADGDLTETGAVMGTPAFMSPEQLRGLEVDQRTDLYSVAATLFEAATGERLHEDAIRDPEKTIFRATRDRALAAAISCALSEIPDRRFPDAKSFAAALARRGRLGVRTFAAVAAAAALVASVAAAVVVYTGQAASPLVGPFALIPFEWSEGAPPARASMAHLLGQRLLDVPGLEIVDELAVKSLVAGEAASRDAYLDAARALGASTAIVGTARPSNGFVRVRVAALALSGGGETVLFEAELSEDRVALGVVESAAIIASTLLRQPIQLPAHSDAHFQAAYSEALIALDSGLWGDALVALQLAEVEQPENPEVAYLQAIATWWGAKAAETVAYRVRRARSLGVTKVQADFLDGLLLITQRRFSEARDHYERALKEAPDDRDLRYGAFEALYHSGHPNDAIAMFKQLATSHPEFRLGDIHVFNWAALRGDEALFRWAIAHFDADDSKAKSAILDARLAVARGQLAEGIAILRAAEKQTANDELRGNLILLLGISGSFDEARALIKPGESVPAYTLALAEGNPDNIAALRRSRMVRNEQAPEFSLIDTVGDRLIDDVIRGDGADAAVATDEMRAQLNELRGALDSEILLAIGDATAGRPSRALARDAHPELRSVVEGLALEAADPAAAARKLAAAVEISDTRLRFVEQFIEARMHRAAGEHERVLGVCGALVEPPVAAWDWGHYVGPCLGWMIDAAESLGRPKLAQDLADRLVHLRRGAPADDPLVVRARRSSRTR